MSFLVLLRDGLRAALAQTPLAYREKHARWIMAQQRPEGGFANRRGEPDLYYTAFALRSLSTLGRLDTETAQRAMRFLLDRLEQPEAARVKQPRGALCDAVMATSWWDSLALCEEVLGPQLDAARRADARAATSARLSALRRPDGGWAKTDVDAAGSLYHTFLVVCVYLRTEQEPPQPEQALAFLHALARKDGGFLENRYSKRPGTNGCAAGVGLSVLLGHLEGLEPHAAFLAGMRNAEGGFCATAGAPMADLLSTYTALITLGILDKLEPPLAAAGLRYARGLEAADGGYVGFALETTPDCEYTFYGLGVEGLALQAGVKV
ncbi:MAG: terpene cyclase/mutase family protein [Planctomycetota bacterium]|nr:terpene cyclase/mutase family protein [Planctomycetota bacterium]